MTPDTERAACQRPIPKAQPPLETVAQRFDLDGRHLAEPRFDLRAWRRERLGLAKQRPEYRGLSPILRQIVDYLVRAHESPEEGITVGQAKLAARFGVHRDTMSRYLSAIVKAGVLTREYRGRKGCYGARGRTTNRYRLSPALLAERPTDDQVNRQAKPDSGSTSLGDVHVEALSPQREHVEREVGLPTSLTGSVVLAASEKTRRWVVETTARIRERRERERLASDRSRIPWD